MSGEVETERLRPGQRVVADRYVLHAELGRGGMGVVWRAEDRVIGRPVAVKEMRLGEGVTAAERTEFEQRILREARTAGRLNDPAVVTVFDVVHDNGSVYIVMELVEAPTLAELVRRSGPLAPEAAAEIGRQVLSALEAAHAAGIVHRDVKPSNIMVGPTGRAKLTDFGIAQAADDPTLTKTGAVIGSPAYLAPERLSGQEASPASDIWSLGATLFFAIEGHAAFERDTTAATLGAVLNFVPYLTRVQGPLAAAVSGMLATAPEGRLAGPQIRSLLAAVGSPGTQVLSPQQIGYSGTMMMPGGGIPTQVNEVSPALAERRRGRLWPVLVGAVVALAAAGAGSFVYGHSSGYDSGKKAQAADDAQPSDAVQVYTVGGPHADFPSIGFDGYDTCLSGPPFAPGTPVYQNVDCSKPHDLEVYYTTDMVNSSFSKYGTDGNGPIPYPSEELAAMARHLCWADRLIGPWAKPAGSDYTYIALIPSEDLWNGAPDLPTDWKADHTLRCVMVNTGGKQLPGDVSH